MAWEFETGVLCLYYRGESRSIFPSAPQPVIRAVHRVTVAAFVSKTTSGDTKSLEALQPALETQTLSKPSGLGSSVIPSFPALSGGRKFGILDRR